MSRKTSVLCCLHLAVIALTLARSALAEDAPTVAAGKTLPKKAAKLFAEKKIWTVHLQFTPEQWAALEPAGGGEPGGFGGGPSGGGPGGGIKFGPAMFLAPAFLKMGDANEDGKLSSGEFQGLGEKWFGIWDKEKTGQVSADQLRAGLNATFAPPGGSLGGGPGGGRPGGGGGPPLQGAEGKRNGLASAMGIEFKYVHADLEFEGQPLKDVAVRYKGNGTYLESRGGLKRSFKIELNKYAKGQKIAGLTTLNFHSNVTDASWMNEVLSFRLYREAGVPAPRTAYARVFVTVPGKYERQLVGLYSLIEAIDNDFADHNFATQKGAIFKPVTPNLFTDLGDAWSKYQQIYDPKDKVSVNDAQRVIDFARLVTKADDAEFAAKLGDFVELDAAARYFAVTVWLATMDSILAVGQNYYLYLHPKTHRFQFVPWDLDHSFGQFFGGDANAQLSIQQPWRGQNRFLERLFKVEAFKTLYLAKLDELSKTLGVPARFAEQVDELAAVLRPSVEEESKEKLARFDRAVSGESAQPGSGGGPRPGGPGGMGGKPIKLFTVARAQSVSEQLAGKVPEGPAPGGRPGGRPGGFGPGNMLGPVFSAAFDADKDGRITHAEFTEGFAKWFAVWNSDQSGTLTDEQLRAGIDKDFAPPPGAFPGGPGAGPR